MLVGRGFRWIICFRSGLVYERYTSRMRHTTIKEHRVVMLLVIACYITELAQDIIPLLHHLALERFFIRHHKHSGHSKSSFRCFTWDHKRDFRSKEHSPVIEHTCMNPGKTCRSQHDNETCNETELKLACKPGSSKSSDAIQNLFYLII